MPIISLQGAEGKEAVVEEHRPGQQKGCRAEHFKRQKKKVEEAAIRYRKIT